MVVFLELDEIKKNILMVGLHNFSNAVKSIKHVSSCEREKLTVSEKRGK